jgi:hypothetical protein
LALTGKASMRRILLSTVLTSLVVLAAAPAMAQHRDDRDWRDHDIHRFREHDFERWRGGHWVNGRHGGRLGWWWVIGPSWYFYPQPIYPYPDPYQPPTIAPPPPAMYYYCDYPPGYYPYVAACPTPWRQVPAG